MLSWRWRRRAARRGRMGELETVGLVALISVALWCVVSLLVKPWGGDG